MRRALLLLGFVLIGGSWPAASAAAAVSAEQAIALLNQQRGANGIPSDLAIDPSLTLGCQRHNDYMRITGDTGHGEDPASPYYTPEGNGAGVYGGNSEVLAFGGGYAQSGRNPWEWAPIHLYLMLDPGRTHIGYDEDGNFACARIRGARDWDESEPPQFFSYPGPGTRGIYPAEQAVETPYTPQQLVGIPERAITGTNILLFSLGARGLQADSFSLVGPEGSVPARMVDETTRNDVGDGLWSRNGGVLVPEQPLMEHGTYHVNVRWRNTSYLPLTEMGIGGPLAESQFFTQEFSFTTGSNQIEEPRPRYRPRLRLRRIRNAGRGHLVRLRLRVDPLLFGHRARFVVYRHERGCGRAFRSAAGPCGWRRHGRRSVRRLRLRRSQVLTLRAPARWQKATVKLRTGGFSSGETVVTPALARYTIKR